ncbi:hypothetical protein [Rhizosphaericola mali]|uniref:Uncharacterized protein n=1 Tax=Rhizosphaericola mali TaxID=2545455 RepID=A0A5P2G3H9_9BACT|nr:hypothetical protein [Rhizosphaericola mali]QES90384.1 hypothetical protein E0W69_017570 [Rhizosphaericola mali]
MPKISTIFLGISLFPLASVWSQNIKSDKIDKKTKIRTIETSEEKISNIKLLPNEGSLKDVNSIIASLFAVNSTKFLKVNWINNSYLVTNDVDSVYSVNKNSDIENLTIANFSILGRKLNMTTQMSVTRYSNTLYLHGNFDNKIEKIIIVMKDKTKLIASLDSDETKFLYQSNLLVANMIGS